MLQFSVDRLSFTAGSGYYIKIDVSSFAGPSKTFSSVTREYFCRKQGKGDQGPVSGHRGRLDRFPVFSISARAMDEEVERYCHIYQKFWETCSKYICQKDRLRTGIW